MSFSLTRNFFSNAFGITFADGGGLTWSFNPNTNTLTATGSGGGVLSSVGLDELSSSPIYSFTNDPLTSNGTLHMTLQTQAANKGFFGPTSGGAAQPTFRTMVNADLPAAMISLADGSGTPIYNISGSPAGGGGTLTFSLKTQLANLVMAGPSSGGAAQPGFRAMVVADLPTGIPNANLANSSVTVTAGTGLSGGGAVSLGGAVTLSLTNPVAVSLGGTGLASYTQGDMLYASGTTTLAKLAAVASGSYLRSAGVGANPVWSTLTLPNAATQGDLMAATAANAIGSIAAVASGSYLRSAGASTLPVWSTVTIPNAATLGDIWYGSAANVVSALAGQTTTTRKFLRQTGDGVNSAAPAWDTLVSGDIPALAYVTSVGLSDGSSTPIYNISGSPVTSSGTLTFTMKTQAANTVLAGPSSGAAAQPTFRALVTADLPKLVPYALIQNAIPMIIPSSGSIGNNGALTGITALPQTYANCYMFFPANAIVAGSAAGLYYVQMSSTTAGTIFNNTYSSGKPTIPGSPTAFSTTGPGAYTQSTSIQTLLSVSVAGGTMGANGALRFYSMWGCANSTNSKTMSTAFGGSNVQSAAVSTTGQIALKIMSELINRGVQNSQVQTAAGQVGFGALTVANGVLSVDTSTSQNIVCQGTLAVATDFIILDGNTVEVIPQA